MEREDGAVADRASEWRRRFGLRAAESGSGVESGGESTLESAAAEEAPADRLERAREQMRRIVLEQFGGDKALLESVSKIALTGRDALKVLETAEREPEPMEFSSLEAIVAFDGTRPSFLVKNGEVDLASSFSADSWKTLLASKSEQLAAFTACVGRVEIGKKSVGTAFLVAPNLAMTCRHVAQLIAFFFPDGIELKPDVWLDFGREHSGRESWDRRAVRKVLFAGRTVITEPVDHAKLDLALLELEESKLPAPSGRDRCLALSPGIQEVEGGNIVIASGYPDDWREFVPSKLRNEYEAVLAKLLEGEKGSKRLAPGESASMLPAKDGALVRTSAHDATTINGNSGSPMAVLSGAGKLAAVGLHYGGEWLGKRTNWAHVLGACMDAKVTGGTDLRSALDQTMGPGRATHA